MVSIDLDLEAPHFDPLTDFPRNSCARSSLAPGMHSPMLKAAHVQMGVQHALMHV